MCWHTLTDKSSNIEYYTVHKSRTESSILGCYHWSAVQQWLVLVKNMNALPRLGASILDEKLVRTNQSFSFTAVLEITKRPSCRSNILTWRLKMLHKTHLNAD